MELVKPYIHLISFPEFEGFEALQYVAKDYISKFMAFRMDTSETSVQRIFWQLFLTLDLIPADGYRFTKCRTRLLFSDIYPGSISDSEITEKSMVLEFVELTKAEGYQPIYGEWSAERNFYIATSRIK